MDLEAALALALIYCAICGLMLYLASRILP